MSDNVASGVNNKTRNEHITNLKRLLELQRLDLKIQARQSREAEIPKQKKRFDADWARLEAELKEAEERVQALQLEQRECEGEIEQMEAQIAKYNEQLYAVKKNEEYQALLHEMDGLKKKIGLKEERILNIMEQLEQAQARLEEDHKRIKAEEAAIEEECKTIDAELAEAVSERESLESERPPIAEKIDEKLLGQYRRVRKLIKEGAAVVPLREESCSGCNMSIPPQVANEILAGEKTHSCPHCGRILYHSENLENGEAA